VIIATVVSNDILVFVSVAVQRWGIKLKQPTDEATIRSAIQAQERAKKHPWNVPYNF
jgi:hypothetical protein